MENIKKEKNGYRKAGLLVVSFALIGVITVMGYIWNFGVDIVDNKAQKESYEAFLRPIVMFDPSPFTDPQNADANFVLQSSMWSALMGENLENYGYDDIGLLIVPASDLDIEAAKLFGPDVKLEHRTFDDYSVSYMYEPDIKAYHVPMDPRTAYTPKVEEIVKQNGSIFLKVGYLSPNNIWFFKTENEQATEPDKYVLYELNDGKEGEQYIKSIEMINNGIAMS